MNLFFPLQLCHQLRSGPFNICLDYCIGFLNRLPPLLLYFDLWTSDSKNTELLILSWIHYFCLITLCIFMCYNIIYYYSLREWIPIHLQKLGLDISSNYIKWSQWFHKFCSLLHLYLLHISAFVSYTNRYCDVGNYFTDNDGSFQIPEVNLSLRRFLGNRQKQINNKFIFSMISSHLHSVNKIN